MSDFATLAAIRFGTGRAPGDDAPRTPAALLARLQAPDQMLRDFPSESFAARAVLAHRMRLARRAVRRGTGGRAEVKALRRKLIEALGRDLRVTLARGIAARVGFRERLTWFWANHFTVVGKGLVTRPGVTPYIDEAIRPHLAGRFADLLKAADTHPMMLIYLDQASSVGPDSAAARRRHRGLNENLAREVMELHTVGVGAPYSQTDVRQFAKLLTSLGVGKGGRFVFRPRWAEPGAETVLGKSYGGGKALLADIHAVLDDLARRSETIRHIATKLAAHFVADNPDPALVTHIEAAWRASDGDLPTIYGALVEHPAAQAVPAAKAKPPFDYIVSALRALGENGRQVEALSRHRLRMLVHRPLAAMGQPFQRPGGPDGWHDRVGDWITPQGLAGRIQWAMTAPDALVRQMPDPRGFVDVALGPRADSPLRHTVGMAASRAEGVGLVLASPEFQRR